MYGDSFVLFIFEVILTQIYRKAVFVPDDYSNNQNKWSHAAIHAGNQRPEIRVKYISF